MYTATVFLPVPGAAHTRFKVERFVYICMAILCFGNVRPFEIHCTHLFPGNATLIANFGVDSLEKFLKMTTLIADFV